MDSLLYCRTKFKEIRFGKTVGKGQWAVGKGCSYRGHKNLLELQKFKVRVNIEKKLVPHSAGAMGSWQVR